jgi:hypothetical protein
MVQESWHGSLRVNPAGSLAGVASDAQESVLDLL